MWVGLYLSVGPRRERGKNQGGSERARGRWGTVVRVRTREPLQAGPREEYPSGTPLLPRRYLCHRNPDASCWLWLLAPAAGTVGVPEERRAEEHTVGWGVRARACAKPCCLPCRHGFLIRLFLGVMTSSIRESRHSHRQASMEGLGLAPSAFPNSFGQCPRT